MYRIMKSTNNGMDELELDSLEKGCWIDIVSPSPEELHEVADATGIQMAKNCTKWRTPPAFRWTF